MAHLDSQQTQVSGTSDAGGADAESAASDQRSSGVLPSTGAAQAASFKPFLCCPLCQHAHATHFHRDTQRNYFHCPGCDLVFVPQSFHLSTADEKQRYDLHENDPADPRYRRFLQPAADAIADVVAPGAAGLDFGCGPGPALAQMLNEAGYEMSLFDPLYQADTKVLLRQYDFITCTETFEHFNDPARAWEQVLSCLLPGAPLVVMTQMRLVERDFAVWRYKDDDTHVAFWSARTFEFLASRHNMEFEHLTRSVVRLTKSLN